MLLYRPVGLEELRLVYEARMRGFPPRLPDQPIFYPVLNEPYAEQIARDWNTKTGTRSGFVTRFEVDTVYAAKFEGRVVGGRAHEELWVPAEELEEFNGKLVSPIEVTSAFFGDDYRGWIAEGHDLEGKAAVEQLVTLASIVVSSKLALAGEVAARTTSRCSRTFSSGRGTTSPRRASTLTHATRRSKRSAHQHGRRASTAPCRWASRRSVPDGAADGGALGRASEASIEHDGYGGCTPSCASDPRARPLMRACFRDASTTSRTEATTSVGASHWM